MASICERGFANGACETAAAVGLLVACNALTARAEDLLCSGRAKYGDEVITDRFILRIQDGSVEIKGNPGSTYTFDGTSYKVCTESRDEIGFEYAVAGTCGAKNAPRAGELQKVTGDLKIRRFDMGQQFVGSYTCKPAARVLNR